MTGAKLVGLSISTSAAAGADPIGEARDAEGLGFDFVSVSDHLHGVAPTFETWTLLTWLASSTSRIGVATRVLGVPYRNPAVVAKMAESLDRLSGGRLILGLGGGHSDDEFRAFGIGNLRPRDKVDGLEDAVRIIRGLWSEPAFTYHGQRHNTDGGAVSPRPERRIPIWLGTYGGRALALTGRVADGWLPSLGFAPPEQAAAMLQRVRSAALGAGRDPDEIMYVYNVDVRIDSEANVASDVVAGSSEEVVERLRGFIGMGFTALNLNPSGPGGREQAARLATDVLPALR